MRKQCWHIDVIAALLLVLVFAVCAMMTLLQSAQVYQAVTARDEFVLDRMTREQYLIMKIQQTGGGFQVRDLNGQAVQAGPVLCCRELIDGEVYEQRIYAYEGRIYEMLCSPELEMEPGDGDWVLSTDRLWFEQTDNGLLVQTEDRSFYVGGRTQESR